MPSGGANRTISTRLTLDPSGYVTGVSVSGRATEQFARNSSRNLSNLSSEFTTLGIAVAAAGAAIVAGLVSATKTAIAFESELTKSVTLIGISREEMDQMGAAALRMSDTGQGPQALAESLFFVQSAGLRGSAAMEVTEAAAKAASIGLGETATIADLTTSAMNAYGAENLSASQATDILVGAVREGKAEADDLAGSMGRAIPIAAQMGIGFDELSAAVAAMTRTGSTADEATTQLRAIMTSLLKPTQQAEEALQQFGLSSAGLRDTIQQDGLWAALMELRNAVGNNNEAFATILPNVRALSGFMDLTGGNVEATEQIFKNMTNTVGLTDEAFEEWSKTTEASIARFSAAAESAKISAAEGLAAPLSVVLDVATSLIKTYTELPGPIRAAGTGMAAFGGATALAGGAALLLLPRIIAARAAMQALGLTTGRTGTALRGLGRAAGAAGALVAVAGILEAIHQASIEAGTGIGEMTEALLDLNEGEVTDAIDTLIEKRDKLADRSLWTTVVTNLRSFGSGMAAVRHDADEFSREVESVDRALAGLVQGGNTREAAQAVQNLGEELGLSGDELKEWVDRNLPEYKDALAAGRNEQELTGDATQDLAGDFEEQAAGTDEATEALQNYQDELRAMTDPVFALFDALEAVEQAQADYNEAVKEYGEDSDEARDASINLHRELENLEQAAIAGDLSFEDFSARLDRWVERGDITEAQAADIRDRVKEARGEAEQFTGEYEATIALEAREAEQKIARLLKGFDDVARTHHATVNISATGLNVGNLLAGRADGGWIDSYASGGRVHGPYDGRAGGRVRAGTGPRSDDVLALVSRGEFVVNAAAAAQHRETLEAINRGSVRGYQGGGEVEMFQTINRQLASMTFSRTPASAPAGNAGTVVQGPLIGTVQAWSDRFSLRQIQSELSFHGSI